MGGGAGGGVGKGTKQTVHIYRLYEMRHGVESIHNHKHLV